MRSGRPVHAGLIEPGHFRFSRGRRDILTSKPDCGSSTKESRNSSKAATPEQAIELAERVSGDTAIGHTWRSAGRGGRARPHRFPDAQRIRAVLLELERMYNHITDLVRCARRRLRHPERPRQRVREQLLRINDPSPGTGCCAADPPGGATLRALPDPRPWPRSAPTSRDRDLALAPLGVRDRFTGPRPHRGPGRDLGASATSPGPAPGRGRRHDHPFSPRVPFRAHPPHRTGDRLFFVPTSSSGAPPRSRNPSR